MRWTRLARTMFLGVSLLCLGLPEAEALEIFAPPGVATHMDDGLITQVRGGARRGGGGMHRGGRHASRRGRRASRRWRLECIAAAERIAAVALIAAGPIVGAPTAAARPTVEARIAAGVSRWRLSRRCGLPGRRRRLSPRRLDPSRVRLGAWRRSRSRRRAWLCQRRGGRVLGRRSPGPRPLLVLYRPEPATGLLGHLPVSS